MNFSKPISNNFRLLGERLFERLQNSKFVNGKTKIGKDFISNLICPDCGNQEAYANTKYPFLINCNRRNNCGSNVKTLELFPEVISNVERDYRPTNEDPHRPAKAYLQARGLVSCLEGLDYSYFPAARQGCGGAVMFPVGTDEYGRKIMNGRLFNPPYGEGKTHNIGPTRGMFWKHPMIDYSLSTEIFVTEGIINALSFIEMGFAAIAILSAGQNPEGFDLSLFKHLILAFDNDSAGIRATKKWIDYLNSVKKEGNLQSINAILCTDGDWNNFLLSEHSENLTEKFDKKRSDFEFNARLVLASTALEYSKIYFDKTGFAKGLFEFYGCYYFSYLKKGKGEKDPEIFVNRISDFTLIPDLFQLDSSISREHINSFAVVIRPQKGGNIDCLLSAEELGSPDLLCKAFLKRARAVWEGDKRATMALASLITNSKISVVRKAQAIGYDGESQAYIYPTFSIDLNGNVVRLSKKNFFSLGRNVSIEPPDHPAMVPEPGLPVSVLVKLMYEAWGEKSLVAVAWAVASRFVTPIKEKINFFPFLSLFGDPQTGKSNLALILNAMQCIEEEGIPVNDVNTTKGHIRKISQRSCLFTSLVEANRNAKTNLDINFILPLYNKNPLQITAIKSMDAKTRELPFNGTLLFSQNVEPFYSLAQKERVISLSFSKSDITKETGEALDKLIKLRSSKIAGTYFEIMHERKFFEEQWYSKYEEAKEYLSKDLSNNRLVENHALILSFVLLICEKFDLNYDLKDYFSKLMILKDRSCKHESESSATYFLEIVRVITHNTFDSEFSKIDITRGELCIHLPSAIKTIKERGYELPYNEKLQDSLKVHNAYKDSNVGRKIQKLDRRVMLFDMKKIIEGLDIDRIDDSETTFYCNEVSVE